MSKCACKECPKSPVFNVRSKLNSIQKQMVGYFCLDCIFMQCSHTHLTRKVR